MSVLHFKVQETEKRLTDAESMLHSMDELVSIARESYELLKQLIKIVGWIGSIVSWAAKVAVAATLIWHGVKFFALKIGGLS